MSQRELLKKILATEVAQSVHVLETGDLEQFKRLRATQDKLLELLQEGTFSDQNKDSPPIPINEEINEHINIKSLQITSGTEKTDASRYEGELFNFYRRQDLRAIYQEFCIQDQALQQDPERRFRIYIETRAKYSKQGFPTNNYAISLDKYRKRNEPVVENEKPVFVPPDVVKTEPEVKRAVIKAENVKIPHEKVVKEPNLLASGPFKLCVLGGLVGKFHFSEVYVRFLGLHEGQLIEVYDKRQNTIPFTVRQMGFAENQAPSNVRSFNLALVELDEETGNLYIERDINNTLLSDVLSDKLALSAFYPTEQTIAHYHLKADDVVELRWIEDEPESLAVSWKYRLAELTSEEEAKRDIARKQKKEKALGFSTSEIHQFDLEGRSILIVGGAPFWTRWREIIEKNNGQLLTYDSHRPNKVLFQAQIVKADLVLFVQNNVSHASSYMGRDLAKEFQKPFIFFKNFGNSIIFDKIRELLEQTKALEAQNEDEATAESLTYDEFVKNYQRLLPKMLRTSDSEEVCRLAADFQSDYESTVMNRQQRRKAASVVETVRERLREVESA